MTGAAYRPLVSHPACVHGARATDGLEWGECGDIEVCLRAAKGGSQSLGTPSASALLVMRRAANGAWGAFARVRTKAFLLAATLVLSWLAVCPAIADVIARLPAHYQLAPERSSVALAVEIIGHTHLRMRFHRIDAELDRPTDGSDDPHVTVTIDATSLDTNKPFVAPIVKSGALLDVAHYPSIRFSSTSFVKTTDDSGFLTGDLTIRGTTRPVTLFVTFERGPHDTVSEADELRFVADGHFSRATFGLSAWPTAVGDDVHMTIHAEFVRNRTSQ
jgi:polyisoprenoid-binding protein YceI